MTKRSLTWTCSGEQDRRVWIAAVPGGCYEIEHYSHRARFVCPSLDPSVDHFSYQFGSVGQAQAFCQQHWQLVGRPDDDSSSRNTRAHQLQ